MVYAMQAFLQVKRLIQASFREHSIFFLVHQQYFLYEQEQRLKVDFWGGFQVRLNTSSSRSYLKIFVIL